VSKPLKIWEGTAVEGRVHRVVRVGDDAFVEFQFTNLAGELNWRDEGDLAVSARVLSRALVDASTFIEAAASRVANERARAMGSGS
jgi:hypothetical protein